MTPEFNEFRLGIVGGCMSHQNDIPFNQLYHRQIAKCLLADTELRLRVSIAHDFELEYRDRLLRLLERASLDGVLLHIRVAFTRKVSLLPVDFPNGKRQRFLHPFLFRQSEFGWNQYLLSLGTTPGRRGTRRVTDPDLPGFDASTIRKLKGRLIDLNFFLGTICGLDDWAIEDELLMLARFHQLCQEQDLPIYVLGPTPCLRSKWQAQVCQKMNSRLKSHLSELGIPFTSFEKTSPGDLQVLIQADQLHLTIAGQQYVAELIYEGLGPWIREISSKV
jgi:hypothetical protein